MASQEEMLRILQQEDNWKNVVRCIEGILAQYLRNEITKQHSLEQIRKIGEPYAGYSGLLFSWILNKKDRK